MEDLVNLPDAPRLIFGLRDTGYNFNTAAAEIIDNSFAANADEINIRIEMAPDGSKFVYFGDNGDGKTTLNIRLFPSRENQLRPRRPLPAFWASAVITAYVLPFASKYSRASSFVDKQVST